jgi:FkbM family methyltransferase
VKQLVKRILRSAGWELHRVSSARLTMSESLAWLAAHHFPVRTILDVGASDGRWSAECMRFIPAANYVLFEPQPTHRDALHSFADRYGDKVLVVRAAVGDHEGETHFDAADPLGGAVTAEASTCTITVPLTTIDEAVARCAAQSPFLLKLDTHGYEKEILAGAARTLRDCAVVIIEAYNFRLTPEALRFWELCDLLERNGFRPVDLVDVLDRESDGALWQMDIVFVRSAWSGFAHNTYC